MKPPNKVYLVLNGSLRDYVVDGAFAAYALAVAYIQEVERHPPQTLGPRGPYRIIDVPLIYHLVDVLDEVSG